MVKLDIETGWNASFSSLGSSGRTDKECYIAFEKIY